MGSQRDPLARALPAERADHAQARRPHNGQCPDAQPALILQIHAEHPISFLREVRDRLQDRGVEASTSSLSRFYARHRITRKRMACAVRKWLMIRWSEWST